MRKKVVFFDIDGTLFDRTVGVPESTKQAIIQLAQNGHQAFICTGRTKPLVNTVEELQGLPFAGLIAGAGTHVEYKKKILSQALFKDEVLDELLGLLEKMNARYTLEGPEHLYYNVEPTERQKFIWTSLLKDKSIVQTYEKGVSRVQKLFVEHFDAAIFEQLRPTFEKNVEMVVYENMKALEMICKGFTKAEGIRILLDELGVSKEDTYAFGDGPNDLQMLDFVQYGIAMGNSEKQVLRQAKYKTESLADDGIYKGLRRFGLIA